MPLHMWHYCIERLSHFRLPVFVNSHLIAIVLTLLLFQESYSNRLIRELFHQETFWLAQRRTLRTIETHLNMCRPGHSENSCNQQPLDSSKMRGQPSKGGANLFIRFCYFSVFLGIKECAQSKITDYPCFAFDKYILWFDVSMDCNLMNLC